MHRVIVPVLVFAWQLLAQTTTGSVEGVVENRVTRAPIPGVIVTVYTRQGSLYEATTDTSGDFRIFGMKPGNYEVRFEKEGFLQGRKEPAQPYPVGQGRDPIRMRLGMVQQVSLRGRVVDADGNPFPQAEVKLLNRNSVPVAPDGTFTFDRLEPGFYTLVAMPKAKGVSEGDRVPVTTYYPSSVDASGAQAILVRGDRDLSGYEIRLQAAEAYSIRGVVLDETGNPKAGVTVRLHPSIQSGPRVVSSGDFITMVGPGPSAGPEEALVVSKADGSFEFPAVHSGEWQVSAVLIPSVESPDALNSFRSAAQAVVLGRRNVDNLQIRLGTPFQLTGTADWGGAPNRRAGLFLSATDGRSGVPSMFGDVNGTLTTRVNPGRYVIVPQPGPGYYPVSVLLGGQEVLGKPVDLLSGPATLRIAYNTAEGGVRGTVENGDGALVVLIPRDVQSMGFGRTLICKADGTFEMSGVPPGDYFVAAFDLLQRSLPSLDAAWLARIASMGTAVSVTQGSVLVQLKPFRYPE